MFSFFFSPKFLRVQTSTKFLMEKLRFVKFLKRKPTFKEKVGGV